MAEQREDKDQLASEPGLKTVAGGKTIPQNIPGTSFGDALKGFAPGFPFVGWDGKASYLPS